MKFHEYTRMAAKTDHSGTAQEQLNPSWMYYGLGIAGESGELAEKVKKLYRDKGGKLDAVTEQDLLYEMGDILWYLSRLADSLGYSLETVAFKNMSKLADRMVRDKIHGDGDNR